MSNRTSIYKFLYSQYGDVWYPGYDYENMLTVERQLSGVYSLFGSGIINGWSVEKLTDNRTDQLLLLDGYVSSPTSEYGLKLASLDLDFTVSVKAATTANITLSGLQTIDGVSVIADDLVLVKNQSTSANNGIYTVSSSGWTRHSSLNQSSDYNSNFVVYVISGNDNLQTIWVGVTSASNFTLGSTNLFFDNAFKQCVKVSSGNGILDKYWAKTEKPLYFRYITANTYYVWAEPGISTLNSGVCNIVSPTSPDKKYNTYNNAAYLATVKVTADTTYSNFSIVNSITLEDRRNQFNETLGEFQRQLNLSYYKHKHLGTIDEPNKIDLSRYLYLLGESSYLTQSYANSSIFVLKRSDGTSFTDSFSFYGNPIVKINGIALNSSEYTISTTTSPVCLYLNDSVSSNTSVQVLLPYAKNKNLTAVSSSYISLSGSLSVETYILLSDGTVTQTTSQSGAISDITKPFTWTSYSYNVDAVYLSDVLVDAQHYSINPTSATIYFHKSLPNYNNYEYTDLVIVLSENRDEITGNLSNNNIDSVLANTIDSGEILSRVLNINHSNEYRYKEICSFTPEKYLVAGLGRTVLYPTNLSSSLQYNDKVLSFSRSKNTNSSFNLIYVSSNRGLHQFNLDSNLSSTDTSWNNDFGVITKIFDNLLDNDENYFKNIFALTSLGSVYFRNSNEVWDELKKPKNTNDVDIDFTDIFVSTNKIQSGSGNTISYTYSTDLYSINSDSLYYLNIFDNESYQNWNWKKIDNIFTTSGSASTYFDAVKSVLEITGVKTIFANNDVDNTIYNKQLYVGSIGTTSKGLYTGNNTYISQKTSEEVKGIYQIKSGEYQKNILWWNDYDLYLTHSAKFIQTTTSEYWEFALTDSDASFTDCHASTNANVSLSGLSAIDGYTPTAGNRILVKNQTDKTENGIYVAASGAWSRSTDFDTSSEYVNYKKVSISNGTLYANSTWFLKYIESFVLDTNNVEWDIYKLKVYSTDTPVGASARSVISYVTERESKRFINEYLVGHSNGIARIQDLSSIVESVIDSELYWEFSIQGSVNGLFSYDDGSNYGKLYASTDNGLFLSSNLLWDSSTTSNSSVGLNYRWKRANDVFSELDTEFSVFNSDYVKINNFTKNYPNQSVAFGSSYLPGKQFYYENKFQKFTTDPWEGVSGDITGQKTRVMVYVNDKPSTIPFTTNSSQGLINFSSSVSAANIDSVKITISKNQTSLTDDAIKPHNSLFSPINKSENSIALLFAENKTTDNILYLNQRIDSSLKLLMLESDTKTEIVNIRSVNNGVFPIEVQLEFERINSTNTFPANSLVYSIKDDVISGLQDDLFIAQSQEKYNVGSVNNSNILNLALGLKAGISTIFDYTAPIISQTDTRGLKNTLLVKDLINSASFDSLNSTYKNRTELIPSSTDLDNDPVVIRSMIDLSKSGLATRIATNLGVWKYNSGYWERESSLDYVDDVNYLKYSPSLELRAGTTLGIWKLSSSWSKINSSKQNHLDFLTGYANGILFEAFAKSDGISVKYNNQSDFSKQASNTVNGLFKGVYVKNTNTDVLTYDSLHACSDDGYYVYGFQSQFEVFSTFLIERKMFSNGNPEGVTRYYKSFQANNITYIPPKESFSNSLYILTNDGILKVRNWKYSYPDDLSSTDFIVDNRYIRGRECFCYALDTTAATGSTPGLSKIYVGTDKGVYKSLDGGHTFEPSEYMLSEPLAVYDLKIFESTFNSQTKNVLVAATDNGLWYTIDDGDNWYRTGEATSDSLEPVSFSSRPTNNLRFVSSDSGSIGYLAQTFTTSATASTITKVSAYITVRDQDNLNPSLYNNSLSNTTLTAYVYSLDGNNMPDTVLGSSSSKKYSDLSLNSFTTFDLTSDVDIPGSGTTSLAIVIKETVSSIPVFSWKKSSLDNPYANGRALYSANDITWSGFSTSYDFFFKVHYDNDSVPTDTINAVGNYDNSETNWDFGNSKGVLVNDSGHLVLDTKFVISNVFDNTKSIQSSTGYTSLLSGFNTCLTSIYNRTNRTVTSYTNGAVTYPISLSYNDLWLLDTSIKHYSSLGFTNSGTAVTNYLSSLLFDGTQSDTFSAIDYATVGLQPQSISDLHQTSSSVANTTNLTYIRDYLAERSLLRLSDLKTRYKNESDYQLTLSPKTSSSTGSTLTFSNDNVNTLTWSTLEFPYAEVVKNGTTLSSGYTLLPATGQVSFGSSIVSSDAVLLNLRKDWDGTATSIPSSAIASSYMLERWSKSFIPLMNLITDTDNHTNISYDRTLRNINDSWNGLGSKLNIFSVDNNSNDNTLRLLSQDANGLYFDTHNSSQWSDISTSLLHGGSNSIFSGYWNREISFDSPKYVKTINTAYVASTGQSVDSSCTVKFKYSTNKKDFSDWILVSSSYTLNKEITNLDFDIQMAEGWNNATNTKVTPYVSQLYYVESTPVIDYLYTTAMTSSENIVNYILSTDYEDFDKVNITWGLCQGDSTNWNDYYTILESKNGVVSSRQKSYKFQQAITYSNLTANQNTDNARIFTVYNNGSKFTWSLEDSVTVKINNVIISSTLYTLDSVNGQVVFNSAILENNRVVVSISKPKVRYESYGEGTITNDNINYYAVNGRWPTDSKIVILVNNKIVRGTYRLNRENGRIIFNSKQEESDIVTIFVLQSSSYKIGMKVTKYVSSASNAYNFGFTKTTAPNSDVYSQYLNTTIPSIRKNTLLLSSKNSYSSVGSTLQVPFKNKVYVDYVYDSTSNNQEYKPKIRWYRSRTAGSITTTIQLDTTPNYRDRISQKTSDTNQSNNYFIENDQIYVEVEPNDNFDTGITYTSDKIIYKDLSVPYLSDVSIKSSSEIVDNKIKFGSTLSAYYVYSDLNSTSDVSLVEWFEWTSFGKNKIAEGSTLSSSFVITGKIISFIVTPNNGTLKGTPEESQIIYVVQ